MIRPLVAILMLAAVLVLIAIAVCIEHRPQGYAMGWLRAGSYPGGSASLRSNLTFDALSGVLTETPPLHPKATNARTAWGLFPTSATTNLPSMKRRQTPCSSAP